MRPGGVRVVTVRPNAPAGRLRVELYGSPLLGLDVPLGAPGADGRRPFTYSWMGVQAQGRLGAFSPQAGAEIVLEPVMGVGEVLCNGGTVIAPAEG